MESPDLSSKKSFNPEELLSNMRAKLDLAVDEYSKRLKAGTQEEFKRRVIEVRTQLNNASERSVEQYDKEIEKLQKYKDIPELFGPASKSAKSHLEITLKAHEQILNQFISNCKDLIS